MDRVQPLLNIGVARNLYGDLRAMTPILPASDGFGQPSVSLDNFSEDLTSLSKFTTKPQTPLNTQDNRGLFGAAFGAIGGLV